MQIVKHKSKCFNVCESNSLCLYVTVCKSMNIILPTKRLGNLKQGIVFSNQEN